MNTFFDKEYSSKSILVTSLPMVASQELFIEKSHQLNLQVDYISSQQTLGLEDLSKIVTKYDGWIIGDDPCPRSLLEQGRNSRLKGIIKWGIGLDNIDLIAAEDLDIKVLNTPTMLGREVADLALTYVNALARSMIAVHESVLNGQWFKPRGISLRGKKIGIVGFGDIGQNLYKRLAAAEMEIIVYEVNIGTRNSYPEVNFASWSNGLEDLDFLVFCCPLTDDTRYMFDTYSLKKIKNPLFLINVSRGEIIAEEVLISGLSEGRFQGLALDVFETEPLAKDSGLRKFKNVIFGTHNASNTLEAVMRVSNNALEKMRAVLDARP